MWMGNVEVGGFCWGGSDVMGFGLEAWVRGRWKGSLICCVCLGEKGCLVLLLGCCFVSVWFLGVELGCCDLEWVVWNGE